MAARPSRLPGRNHFAHLKPAGGSLGDCADARGIRVGGVLSRALSPPPTEVDWSRISPAGREIAAQVGMRLSAGFTFEETSPHLKAQSSAAASFSEGKAQEPCRRTLRRGSSQRMRSHLAQPCGASSFSPEELAG